VPAQRADRFWNGNGFPRFRQVENFATGKGGSMKDQPRARRPIYYTPRILPCFPHVGIPLEVRQILWQR
jgi:hypothetical protein